jgi:hypothetical protein
LAAHETKMHITLVLAAAWHVHFIPFTFMSRQVVAQLIQSSSRRGKYLTEIPMYCWWIDQSIDSTPNCWS